MIESERASAKRRRRTRYTALPGILENAIYPGPKRVATNATRLTPEATMVWTVYEMALFGRELGGLRYFLGCHRIQVLRRRQAGCASCACVRYALHVLVRRSLSA